MPSTSNREILSTAPRTQKISEGIEDDSEGDDPIEGFRKMAKPGEGEGGDNASPSDDSGLVPPMPKVSEAPSTGAESGASSRANKS